VQDTCASNIEVFFQEIQCFFHSQEWSYFPQRWCSSHLKTTRDRKYSFQKVREISLGNNVQDTPASKTDCIVPCGTCVSPFHLKRVFFIKWMILPHQNTFRSQYSFHKLTQFSQWNNVLHPSACNIDDFLPWDTVLVTFTWMVLFCLKWCSSHLKTPWGTQYSFKR
jgi:hypothetical protein